MWVTEEVHSIPKNIYGITKIAAESLCELFHRKHGLKCIALRTSRFFPDEDDSAEMRGLYSDANIKANEFLFRRADLHDVVTAHISALQRVNSLGFVRLLVSATTPFKRRDAAELRTDALSVVQRYYPGQPLIYERLGWTMFPSIDRVYDNSRARELLDWEPIYDYQRILESAAEGSDPRSEIARAVGTKYYHAEAFEDGPYPVA